MPAEERRVADVGLLDYYKQFEGMTEEEVNSELREEAAERKRKALTRVETLDLSQTTWPDLPHPDVVSAITFVARRGMQRYPHMRGSQLRARLAERHSVDPARLIVGNGAAELLSAATRALIEPGQELITSWPSYPLFPIMARRAHGRAVPVERRRRRRCWRRWARARAWSRSPVPTTRPASCCRRASWSDCLRRCPSTSAYCSTSRLSSSPTHSRSTPRWRCWRTTLACSCSAASPRLGGWRGCAAATRSAAPGAEELLAELEPDLGVSEISQAGALESLRNCSELLAKRVRRVCKERERLTTALRQRDFELSDSQANFLWVAHPTLDGGELAARLARSGILVAAGDALGEPRHVRIAIRDEAPRRVC